MNLNDITVTIVIILFSTLLFCWVGYVIYLILDFCISYNNTKRLKKIVLDIITKEDDQIALDIISDEYAKEMQGKPSFVSLVGKIATELRNGDYSKYYDKIIEDPMTLAKRLDAVLRLYNDKATVDRFEKSEFVKDFGFESDEQMTKQDMLMVYGKINAYYLGRIHEKDTEIDKLKKKLAVAKIAKALSYLGWVIGLISGVLTIVNHFFK